MAETKRVIYYDQLSGNQPTNGDVIFVDNPNTGTHKMDLKSFVDAINNGFDSSIKSSGVSVSADNYSSIITNVNDQPVNSIYTYGAGLQSKVSNLPSNKAMTIINFAQKSTGGLGQVMLAVERNGSDDYLYFRTIGGSPAVWSSWVKVANLSDLNSSITSSNTTSIKASNYTNYWDDLNNQPVNTIYVYDSDVYSHIANMPPSTHGITIVHYTPNKNAIYGRVMLAVDLAGDNRAVYFRAATSSSGSALWSNWKKIIGIGDNYSNTFYYENEVFSPSFSMTPGIVISNTTGESGSASVTICSDLNYYPMVKDKKYHFWTDSLSYNVYFYDENYNDFEINPDFYIECKDGSHIIIEHLGKLGDKEYADTQEHKLRTYHLNGYDLGHNLIFTSGNSSFGLDSSFISDIIYQVILPRAKTVA